MSNATKAYGASLHYSTNGTTYTEIAQTVDLGGPEPEVGEIKITNNDSPDNTQEYIPGLIEPGDYEFQIVYAVNACATIYSLMDAQTVYYWRVTFPDGAKWEFRGFVKGFGTEGQTDDGAIMTTMTIKLTGKPTFLVS